MESFVVECLVFGKVTLIGVVTNFLMIIVFLLKTSFSSKRHTFHFVPSIEAPVVVRYGTCRW